MHIGGFRVVLITLRIWFKSMTGKAVRSKNKSHLDDLPVVYWCFINAECTSAPLSVSNLGLKAWSVICGDIKDPTSITKNIIFEEKLQRIT